MTNPTNVSVTKLADGNKLLVDGPSVDVGDKAVNQKLNEYLAKVREGREMYLVAWRGSKIPRGVKVKGYQIVWTQNGVVTASGGMQIGTYQRLKEFGGDSGDEHIMVIYLSLTT